MIYLYYAKIGAESAERLAEEIANLGANVTLKLAGEHFKYNSDDLCVSWGVPVKTKTGTWLNRAVNSDKLYQLQTLAAHGVPTPCVSFQPGPAKYARLKKHHDGSDLVQQLSTGDYYVQHVKTTSEYRVHVFDGTVLRASLKVACGPQPHPIFKVGAGWGFSSHNYAPELSARLLNTAIRAVECVGLDFGGVDIATTADGVVVFEVNSAPWLGGDASRKYAKCIVTRAKALH